MCGAKWTHKDSYLFFMLVKKIFVKVIWTNKQHSLDEFSHQPMYFLEN